MLEDLVVVAEAAAIELVERAADAPVLERSVGHAVGVELSILGAEEVVHHVAAVLAAVNQTGANQIEHGGHEEGVLACGNTLAIGILHEGLQLSHVAGQAVEGEQ